MIDRPITLATAGSVIAGERGDPLEQRRFARPVLTDDDGDGALEAQLEVVSQERQAERIGFAVRHARRIEPEPLEIRRRQVDVALSSCHDDPPPSLTSLSHPAP
jgi:hypothetical protein